MNIKKLWIAISILLLVFCVSSCHKSNDDASINDSQTHTHTPSGSVKENVAEPTCEKDGSYDEVVYCSECGEEISRTKINTTAVAHQYKNQKCVICGIEKASDGLNFKSNGNGTCSVSGIGSCKDNDIVVPTVSPSGDKVTEIAASAFYNCVGLTSIRIPDTVTSIGNNAFADCANLQSIIVSNNLNSLGAGAFSGCDNLKYNNVDGSCYLGSEHNPYLILIKPEDKTKTLYEINQSTVFIDSYAFSSCENVTNIIVHDGVISIGACAFQGCSELVSVTLPKDLSVISDGLFSNCRKLESVNIPDGVTKIENQAFSYCTSLKTVELPNSLKSIGQYAFYFCSSITDITIPNSVTTVNDYAFQDCSNLISIILPDGITYIAGYMFKNCCNLKSVTIPSRVTKVGEQAFENCKSLESIVIPASVKTIEKDAFKKCSGLESVRFEKTNGWQCFDSSEPVITYLELTDEEKNALTLSFRYNDYTWKRG